MYRVKIKKSAKMDMKKLKIKSSKPIDEWSLSVNERPTLDRANI
ncbi:hypothetical protein [Staphylococcus felis]|nr:hypothetical protein [Staphylococcus felis]